MPRDVRVGSVFASFRARNEQFLNASRQNVAALRRQRQAARDLSRTAFQLRNRFMLLRQSIGVALGSAIFAGASAGLRDIGRSSAQLGANLRESASTVGLTVAEIQTLGRVFEGGGASQDAFVRGLRTFQRNLVQAQLGLTTYRREFELLGIDVDDLRRRGVSGGEAFLEFAEGLRRTNDQSIRLSAAQTLAGRSAAQLLNVLQEGRAAIESQAAQFASLGVLTDEQADQLKRLEQSYTDTGNQIRTQIASITADNANLFDSFNRLARIAAPALFNQFVSALEFLRQNMEIVRAAFAGLIVVLLRSAGVFRVVSAVVVASGVAMRGLVTGTVAATNAFARLRNVLLRTGLFAVAAAAVEAVFRFRVLSRELGSSAEAFRLIGEAGREIFTGLLPRYATIAANRIVGSFRGTAAAIIEVFRTSAEGILQIFTSMPQGIRLALTELVNTVIQALNRVSGLINQSGLADFLNIRIGAIDEIPYQELGVEIEDRMTLIGQRAREAFQREFSTDVFALPAEQATPALDRLIQLSRTAATQMETSLGSLNTAATGVIDNLNTMADTVAETAAAQSQAVEAVAENVQSRFDQIYASSIDRVSTLIGNSIAGLEDFGQAARNLARSIISEILAAYARSAIFGLLGRFGLPLPLPGFQQGGLAQRGFALVGEAGPEIIDFNTPGRVYTNEQLGSALTGRGMTFNFAPVINSSDAGAVNRALADAYPLFEDRITARIRQDLHRPSTMNRR